MARLEADENLPGSTDSHSESGRRQSRRPAGASARIDARESILPGAAAHDHAERY